MELDGRIVYVTGKFEIGKTPFVQMRAKAQGANVSYNDTFFNYLLVGEKPGKRVLAKAEKEGIEQLGHDEAYALLSTPLHAYAERLGESVAGIEGQKKYHCMIYKHIGEPASAEAIAAAEEKIGMPLDPVLRRFYEQMNGVTLGYRKPFRPEVKAPPEVVEGPYPHELFMDAAPNSVELWRCPGGKNPKEVSFGKKTKIKGSDIFLFDATYGYQPIYLGIERRKKVMSLAVGHDHAAGFGDFIKVDLEAYLEQFVHRTHLSLTVREFGDRRVGTWWG